MTVPDALAKLFQWIESNGFHEDTDNGRIGYLYPIDKLREEWTDTQRPGGTLIEFYAEQESNLWYVMNENTKNRMRVFARTGGDGSVAAFWLDDNGEQQIVHVGSGSGSVLACVLCTDPIDFLRLIAIGYDEICWDEEFSSPPREAFRRNDFTVKPNLKYQDWLVQEFKTTIPGTAHEIVKNPSEFGDVNSRDPFCNWLNQNDA